MFNIGGMEVADVESNKINLCFMYSAGAHRRNCIHYSGIRTSGLFE